jgi:hypothetical protein
MDQSYLNIIKEFVASREDVVPESPPPNDSTGCVISVLSVISPDEPTWREQIEAITPETPEFNGQRVITEAMPPIGLDSNGAYDGKATLPGAVPPLQAAQELQEWLAGIDWRYGLRCGISGLQCRHCRGIPCEGSTEWLEGQP